LKDIVENRRRITFGQKLGIAWLVLRENGFLWCLLLLAYYLSSSVAHQIFTAMDRLRRAWNIPGLNSATLNKKIWESWDWSGEGDEWSESEEWKQSLIRCVLDVQMPRDCAILEIGPGGGRWTAPLLERAREYVGVDISSTCVDHCRERFRQFPNATFIVGSGRDLAQVPDDSVDAIWSFDVFVHINRSEVTAYAKDFLRVLRPGGVAAIHHGAVGGAQGGWRSNLTAEEFASILAQNKLQVLKTLDQWTDGPRTYPMRFGDLITVFTAPPLKGISPSC
jgi:ubiquinone/menaquinone biosynthesis C-methylase UbiE